MTRLIIAGSLTIDNVIAPNGERLPPQFGGNVAYAAAGAALWADSIGLVTRIGADYPQAFLAALAAHGLDLSGVRSSPHRHGMNVAFWYRPDGSRERCFPPEVTVALPDHERARFHDYTVDGPAARYRVWFECTPEPADLPPAWLTSAAGCHAAAMPVQRHIALMAHVRRARPDLDLQVDSPWYDERDQGADFATPLFARIDRLLPSEADLAVAFPGVDPVAAARALCARGARCVVVKRGAAGSLIVTQDGGAIAIPIVPVAVLDPTGAGDAYCGGFLAGMTESGDVVRAAAMATVAASFAVETVGPLALLAIDRKTARRRLDEFWQRRPLR